MFTKEDEGRSIYCLLKGKGIIIEFLNRDFYPVVVQFENDRACYTEEGKLYADAHNPILFFSKPEIIAPPRSKRMTTKQMMYSAYINSEGMIISYVLFNESGSSTHKFPINIKGSSTKIDLIGTIEVEED